jgi:dihydrofolate reductase
LPGWKQKEKLMRKIIGAAFVSLDGVMQAPGGPEEDPTSDFNLGGWTFHYWDDVTHNYMMEGFSKPFELLLGRKTYDIFAAHWPYAGHDDPIAVSFNKVTKYVATHTPDMPLSWHNSQTLGKDVVTTLRDLKQQDGPDLLIQGSSELVQSLLANDLIDEFSLLTFPVVLGSGKRFFGDGAKPIGLKLTKSVVSSTGIVIAYYERAGTIKTGSFALEQPTDAEIERRKNLSR